MSGSFQKSFSFRWETARIHTCFVNDNAIFDWLMCKPSGSWSHDLPEKTILNGRQVDLASGLAWLAERRIPEMSLIFNTLTELREILHSDGSSSKE